MQDFSVKRNQRCILSKAKRVQKWSHKNLLRDNIARSCHLVVVFFIKGVRFSDKGIFVTVQIDWRTVLVVRFSVIWWASAFSNLWKLSIKIIQLMANKANWSLKKKKKNQKLLNKSIYFWLAFESYCFHGHA